jgi:hypothetical protein
MSGYMNQNYHSFPFEIVWNTTIVSHGLNFVVDKFDWWALKSLDPSASTGYHRLPQEIPCWMVMWEACSFKRALLVPYKEGVLDFIYTFQANDRIEL